MPETNYSLYPAAEQTDRTRYFSGQFLGTQDFVDEQRYHVDRLRRSLRQLRIAGVAHGLEVTSVDRKLRIAAGTALDDSGRQLVLTAALEHPTDAKSPGDYVLTLEYDDHEDRLQGGAAGGRGREGHSRFAEVPRIHLVLRAPQLPAGHVPLAAIAIAANGTLTVTTPSDVRRYSGLRLPGPNGRGPVLASGGDADPDRLVLTGALTVTGDLTATANPIWLTSAASARVNATTNVAEISNDTTTYKTLMIFGNRSAGLWPNLGRRVSVWDRLEVNGHLLSTESIAVKLDFKERPKQSLHVRGRMYLEEGVIQRGGEAITETDDLGLYSQVPTEAVRYVTKDGPHAFYTDGGIGSLERLTIKPDGEVKVAGEVAATANPIWLTSAASARVNAATNVAEISNDTTTYKTLMIFGNRSAGLWPNLGRRVSVWDRLEVNGHLLSTETLAVKLDAKERPKQSLHVRGRMYLEEGVIQRGGEAITETDDLGLYSQVPTEAVRYVTKDGPHAFYTDGGIGSVERLTIKPDGEVKVAGDVAATANPIWLTSAASARVNAATNVAEISNDTTTYKTLMIFGNRSAGLWPNLGRRVSVWDRLEVNGHLLSTETLAVGLIATTRPTQSLHVQGRMYLHDGVIQRGGDQAITQTSDLGLYSQIDGAGVRHVTKAGRHVFYTDGGIGTVERLAVEASGEVKVPGALSVGNRATINNLAVGSNAQFVVDADGNTSTAGTLKTNRLVAGSDARFTVAADGRVSFASHMWQMLNLWGDQYALGVQSSTMYLRSASNFAFFTGGTHHDGTFDPGSGGTAAMVIAAGNVGIGTTTPGPNRLQVEGATRLAGALTVTGAAAFADSTVSGTLSFGAQARQMLNLYGEAYALGVQASTMYLRSATNFAFFTGGTHDVGTFNPGSGGTAAMVIAAGNVGIGTTTPGPNRLQVEGATRLAGALTVTGAAVFADSTVSGTLSFGAQGRQMLNLHDGDYGLGVQSSTTYLRSVSNFAFFTGGTHHDGTFNPGSGGTAAMVIAAGNVGIGTTTPGANRLKVEGATCINGGTLEIIPPNGANKALQIHNGHNADMAFTINYRADAKIYFLHNSRSLAANTPWTPGSGNCMGTDGVWQHYSDRRLKHDIRRIDDALDLALKLDPVRFTWNDLGTPGIGFIAQDVQALLPELVSETTMDASPGETRLMMSYNAFGPIAIAAIKQLHDRFERRIADLEAQVRELALAGRN